VEKMRQNLNMIDLLKEAVEKRASDLHITVGRPPVVRIDGELLDMDYDPLDSETAEYLIYSLLAHQQRDAFEDDFELDFAYDNSQVGRFRVNVYRQKGFVGAALRIIPSVIPSLEELNLPETLAKLAMLPSGMIVITGPSGCGKSTTLASMIDIINTKRKCHIVTIEDPIEFMHQHKSSIVTQREVSSDTKSFQTAMKHVLRHNPDVILIGEMRDLETMEMAVTAAETGHLVLTTLHTLDAPQAVDRIVDLFYSHQQQQIRTQLGGAIRAVIAQQLLPRSGGVGLVPVLEIMIATPGIRNLIRKGDTHQLYSVIQTGGQSGMQTMNQCLRDMVDAGLIDMEVAEAHSQDVEELRRMLK
jgi:twitching motility protein PilT